MVNGEQYAATSWRHQSRRRYDAFRVPAMVLVAGAIIFEGYAQLGAIGSPVYLRGSMAVALFSGASLIVITLVDDSAGGRHHQSSVRSLVVARALLFTATFAVFLLPRPVGSRTLGASDLGSRPAFWYRPYWMSEPRLVVLRCSTVSRASL